jgi:two-component system chemotaxis sensor kinase CheA
VKHYDHLLSPVAAFGRDMSIVYFNATFAAFFQLPPRKIRGKSLAEVLAKGGGEAQRLAEECFVKGEPVVSGELEVKGGEGPKEVVLKFFPIVLEEGEPGAVVTIQDFSIERILHEKHRAQLEELKAKNAEIQKYSEGLELLVEERTKELRLEKEETESILKSLSEGLIVIGTDLLLSEKSSRAASTLLGHERLAQMPALDVLFPDTERCKNADDRRKVEMFLASAFNLFIPDQFEDLARFAPKQMRFSDPVGSGALKTYALSYSAVIENDAVVKVVVAVRDDTELEELRQLGVTIHKKIVEALERTAAGRANPAFGSFAREAAKQAREAKASVAALSQEKVAGLFRTLHTVKGGTRTFALAFLQYFAHEAETVVEAVRDGREAGLDKLEALRDDVAWLERGLTALEGLCGEGVAEGSFERRGQDDGARAWRASVEAIKNGFGQLAEDLGKRARLSFSSSQRLDEEERVFLEQVLVHLLRNALDHGVETPDARLAVSKHPEAAVSIRVADDGDQVTVVVEDDGAGIDRHKVRRLAIARGLLSVDAPPLSLEQALAILVHPGFSTKDRATDVSGRGVGLDAVRAALLGRGGDIALLYSGPTGTKFRLTWRKRSAALRAS